MMIINGKMITTKIMMKKKGQIFTAPFDLALFSGIKIPPNLEK